MPPAISVVMPTYNSQAYIRHAVCSILNQTMMDWELVVVDDGCTDQTIRRVTEISSTSYCPGRIRVVRQKHQGCAAATHRGICEAHAQVVTVVDSDDAIRPYALACVTYLMYLYRDVGYMWTRFDCGNANNSVNSGGWAKDLPSGMSLLQSFCKTAWWGGQHQRAIRRSVYLKSGGLDTRILYAVDLQLAAVMSSTACSSLFFNYPLYWYRMHRSHITGQHRSQQRGDHTKIIRSLRERCRGQKGGPHRVITLDSDPKLANLIRRPRVCAAMSR